MATPDASLHGVLPVDKPAGPTSHDVVGMARRALRTKRVGHTGTLDPFATGLLLLCIGNATRIAEYLTAESKRYTATVRLGVVTDTDDHTGTVLDTRDAAHVTRAQLDDAVARQRGTILQTPPDYSAKKKAGRRAYQLAREGVPVELEPVSVTVHVLDILSFEDGVVQLDVTCSSGTYIRAIARDIGAALGVGGHLSSLRRTAVGPYSVDDALPLEAMANPDAVSGAMIATADAVGTMPRVHMSTDDVVHIRHGRSVRTEHADAATAALLADGELIAIGAVSDGVVRPRKVFA